MSNSENYSFKHGDRVLYFPTGTETNPTSGTIKEVVSSSSDNVPRYVISNDKTHKMTTYKPENIIEKVNQGSRESKQLEEQKELESEEEEEEIYDPEVIDVDTEEDEEEFVDEKEIVRDY